MPRFPWHLHCLVLLLVALPLLLSSPSVPVSAPVSLPVHFDLGLPPQSPAAFLHANTRRARLRLGTLLVAPPHTNLVSAATFERRPVPLSVALAHLLLRRAPCGGPHGDPRSPRPPPHHDVSSRRCAQIRANVTAKAWRDMRIQTSATTTSTASHVIRSVVGSVLSTRL